MKTPHSTLVLITLGLIFTNFAHAQSHFARIETGSVSTGYNYFQIPGDTGTRVDLPKGDSAIFFRFSGGYKISDHSLIRILIAPLKTSYKITPTSPLEFNEQTFSTGESTTVDYKFNSYRASYIYYFETDHQIKPRLGATLKIRDAYISVSQSSRSSTRSDLGFVPLINLGAEWQVSKDWSADFDLDGLASPQGRAFDGILEGAYLGINKSRIALGYRFVEGGADNKKVKNFALFNYWAASFSREF